MMHLRYQLVMHSSRVTNTATLGAAAAQCYRKQHKQWYSASTVCRASCAQAVVDTAASKLVNSLG